LIGRQQQWCIIHNKQQFAIQVLGCNLSSTTVLVLYWSKRDTVSALQERLQDSYSIDISYIFFLNHQQQTNNNNSSNSSHSNRSSTEYLSIDNSTLSHHEALEWYYQEYSKVNNPGCCYHHCRCEAKGLAMFNLGT
jgi:peptide methionine sulfoxide reductase MsrA